MCRCGGGLKDSYETVEMIVVEEAMRMNSLDKVLELLVEKLLGAVLLTASDELVDITELRVSVVFSGKAEEDGESSDDCELGPL